MFPPFLIFPGGEGEGGDANGELRRYSVVMLREREKTKGFQKGN